MPDPYARHMDWEARLQGVYLVPVYPSQHKGSGLTGEAAGPYSTYDTEGMSRALKTFGAAGAYRAYRLHADHPDQARSAVAAVMNLASGRAPDVTRIDLEVEG